MKISAKLQTQIKLEVQRRTDEILSALDAEFRSGQMSHDVWKRLHQKTCGVSSVIEENIVHLISMYRR